MQYARDYFPEDAFGKGATIKIDPDHQLEEITGLNNVVKL